MHNTQYMTKNISQKDQHMLNGVVYNVTDEVFYNYLSVIMQILQWKNFSGRQLSRAMAHFLTNETST